MAPPASGAFFESSQLFAPIQKGGGGSRTRSNWGRQAREFPGDEAEQQDRSYTLHYESRYEMNLNGETVQNRLFICQPLFVFDSSMFGVDNPYETAPPQQQQQHEQEDDRDCGIPDEYKKIAERSEIDVMAYLGLKRAEPLLANKNVDDDLVGEWE